MADTIEKIYSTDGRDNDLAAILAATKSNDPATMMAAMGGGMNNPFVYLVWMMFANRMWGGEQNCNPAIQAQIDSLRNQMADNQNSNLLMDAVHGNTAAIAQLAGNLNCDLKTNDNAGVQRIIDTMNGHWNQELQMKYNDSRRELSQRDQTQAIVAGITAAVSQIIAASKTTTTTP